MGGSLEMAGTAAGRPKEGHLEWGKWHAVKIPDRR